MAEKTFDVEDMTKPISTFLGARIYVDLENNLIIDCTNLEGEYAEVLLKNLEKTPDLKYCGRVFLETKNDEEEEEFCKKIIAGLRSDGNLFNEFIDWCHRLCPDADGDDAVGEQCGQSDDGDRQPAGEADEGDRQSSGTRDCSERCHEKCKRDDREVNLRE